MPTRKTATAAAATVVPATASSPEVAGAVPAAPAKAVPAAQPEKTPKARKARKAVAPTKVAKPAPAAAPTKAAQPAPKVAPKAAPKPAPKPVPKAAPKLAKPRDKLVRDSFTMPQADFVLIDALKMRALSFSRPTKKSELLRAGLQALAAMPTAALQAALGKLVPLKTGRPKKSG